MAVVLLVGVVQQSEFVYWQGFSLWALLLGTAVVTALWLEGRPSEQLFNWDMLRLGFFGLLLLLAGPTGFALAAGLVYAAANLIFLTFLRHHQPAAGNAAAAL